MEIGHKVSFVILVFYHRFCHLAFYCFIVRFFPFLSFASCILRPASASFLSSVRSTDHWGDMGEFSGRGQCTDLASWPLHKMYMLLLAVSARCLS